MADAFTNEAFSLLAVGITVVGLRTYSRYTSVGIRNFMLDDYLMLLAVVVYSLETAAAYSVGAMFHGLANNSMTDEERQNLSPDSEEYALRVGGSKLQLIGWSLYTLLLWLLKTCMNIFYSKRLTTGLHHMRVRTRIGFVLIGSTYVVTITAILGGCGTPFSKNWQINPDPGNHCQPAVSNFDLFFTVVLNVVSDIYLLAIPLPLFWRAQIEPKKKAWLLVLFSGGIFVMMAGILRCALILTAGANGAQQAGSWAVRESFVAVVIGNIPMIQPLFTRAFRKIGTTRSTRRLGNSSNSYPMKDSSKFSRKPRSVNPITTSSSAEQIIDAKSKTAKVTVKPGPEAEVPNIYGIYVMNETTIQFNAVDEMHEKPKPAGY